MDKDERGHRGRDLDLEDPLGIAREPVAKDERIRASSDEASVRRRRKRALGPRSEDRRTFVDLADDPEGATGIDMGAGGDGTGIKRND